MPSGKFKLMISADVYDGLGGVRNITKVIEVTPTNRTAVELSTKIAEVVENNK